MESKKSSSKSQNALSCILCLFYKLEEMVSQFLSQISHFKSWPNKRWRGKKNFYIKEKIIPFHQSPERQTFQSLFISFT